MQHIDLLIASLSVSTSPKSAPAGEWFTKSMSNDNWHVYTSIK